MNKRCIILLLAAAGACTPVEQEESQRNRFSAELIQLQNYFHIPGLAVIVQQEGKTLFEEYNGFTDVIKQEAIDSLVAIPMASLTKMFSGILIMKLVDHGKLSLDESINKYLDIEPVADSIKIKHVLSHTSQGTVGAHFYYSSRFSWITQVIEKKYEKPFDQVMHDEIIEPLNLKNTFLLRDSAQIVRENRKIAQPYFWEGLIKDGVIDFGYSAAAGLVSTVRDMAKLSNALDRNVLIAEHSKLAMFTPFGENLPYGYGIFTEEFQGVRMIWGYGQYDCYSSLFLKVPEQKLTLVIAANNNLLSDPPRLLYGDVTYSLFALSFLKNYVFETSNIPLIENEETLGTLNGRINPSNSGFYRKKLLAQALAESYLAMFDVTRAEQSKKILSYVFEHFPKLNSYGDLTLLHNLSFLKDIAVHNGQGNFTNFDEEIMNISHQLLEDDRVNPYANYYLANYHVIRGNTDSARLHYNRILTSVNFSRNWYTTEAGNWVEEHK